MALYTIRVATIKGGFAPGGSVIFILYTQLLKGDSYVEGNKKVVHG
jgi:hypothetical protein